MINQQSQSAASTKLTDPNRYLVRGGEVAFNPPFSFQETGLYGFLLEGDLEKLQALCDRYLNLDGAQNVVRYSPLSHYVLLTFQSIQRAESTEPIGQGKGFGFEDGEVTFWFLTRATNQQTNEVYYPWFVPYIFTDSAPAIAAGLAYGFPKIYATVSVPHGFSLSPECSFSTLVLETFSSDSKTVERQIASVTETRRTVNSNEDLKQVQNNLAALELDDLEATFQEEFQDLFDRFNLEKEFQIRQQKAVFLKQFRSAENGNNACYKAVVEADINLNGFSGFPPFWIYTRPSKFQIEIADFASCPIAYELGLQNTQAALFASWASFDFSISNGREIWKVNP